MLLLILYIKETLKCFEPGAETMFENKSYKVKYVLIKIIYALRIGVVILPFHDFIEFKFHKTMFCSSKNNPIISIETNRFNHFSSINNVSF